MGAPSLTRHTAQSYLFSFVFFCILSVCALHEFCIECESGVLCNRVLLRLTDDWCPIQLDFTFKGGGWVSIECICSSHLEFSPPKDQLTSLLWFMESGAFHGLKFLERWGVVWWGTHWSNSQTFSGSFIYSENIHIEYITAIGQISSKFEWNVPGTVFPHALEAKMNLLATTLKKFSKLNLVSLFLVNRSCAALREPDMGYI